jgi:Fur family transcriptional regulator, ferric uptake regulator
MEKELELLNGFIRSKGLRYTPQRNLILEVFLSSEGHLSVDELHQLVIKKDSSIGYTTVYRTMKLFVDCGLADEVDFSDGVPRYEHKYGHEHHDHLICVECGKYIEAVNPRIEQLQDDLARELSFVPMWHKLQIFGRCKDCQ